ncbi:MAG TPA: class II aldolase/adducin family protein [Candidatus Acidoferrales bacterium]|nr:class II aldolase/adducin family protein [Candidatus Acidoferrales bacterium]
MDRAAAISELVTANRVVAHLKLVDSFGHVTVRNPENSQRFLMSRARAPRLVTKGDILEFDLDSTPMDLRGLKPYSERFIHGCIYKARPDVMAICHNHAHELLPLAVTKTVMRPALHTAAVIGHEVPVWDIRDQFGDTNMLVASNEMGASLANSVGPGKAALMRGHGSVVVGANVQDAVFTAFYLCLNADVIVKAMSTGETITYLSPGEVDRAGELHSQPAAQGRAWEDWCSQANFVA